MKSVKRIEKPLRESRVRALKSAYEHANQVAAADRKGLDKAEREIYRLAKCSTPEEIAEAVRRLG